MRSLGVFLVICSVALAQQRPATAPGNATAEKRLDSLHEFSTSVESLSRDVGRSVVQIFATGYTLSDEGQSGTKEGVVTRQRDTGSGVVLTEDGYIVTNGHVVSNARHVRVRFPSKGTGHSILQPAGKTVDAKIVGVDRDSDIALLKVEETGLPHLDLGDSDSLRQGQLVLAFGNPMGLDSSVSMGVVSSVARQIRPDDPMIYVQTDAPINPGNSGGPLVNADGRVMGINTFILSQSGGSEGLGFAIPSNIISNVFRQLKEEGHVHRSEIGISTQTITTGLAAGLRLPQDWGVLVSDVAPDGPAEDAGLQVGDIVVSLNGKPMENARQLEVNLYRYRVGQKVNIEVQRNGSKLTYMVPVVEQEGDPERFADLVDPVKNMLPKLGILGVAIDRQIAEMLPEIRKKYGVVVAARTGEPAYTGDRLQIGDVIYTVNTTPVTSIDALRSAVDGLKETDPLVLQVEREGKLRYLTMGME